MTKFFYILFCSKIFLWQNANALIIIRYVCNFLVQRLSEKEFINYFESTLVESPTGMIDHYGSNGKIHVHF
jgi:hypothetical protein